MSLVVEGLSVEISGRQIVRNVSFQVADGERVGLIGSSGSGKSMITKAILGLLPEQATVNGSIRLFGEELVGIGEEKMADLRGSYMGAIFQNPSDSLNPVLTVAQQVSLPLRLHYRLSKGQRQQRVESMLDEVGLDGHIAGKYPSQLSGGQQQRVAIATALVTSPKVIIADEPTTALDAITQHSIINLLTCLVDRSGASLLFVTHDFAVLSRVCQRSYVIDHGDVIEGGNTQVLLQQPQEFVTKELVKAARTLTLHVSNHGQ